jgi:outer membrane protein assembly factor BamB
MFRGPGASGVGAGTPPARWDVRTGQNIAWKTPIPGLAHSSPIVWGDRIYVTTAVAEGGAEAQAASGDYSKLGIGAAKDLVDHSWRLYALDRRTGKIMWRRTLAQGVPRVKRHVKGSHANATPATDGHHIVALAGSEGLFCLDRDGRPLWKRDLGLLDAGEAGEPQYQWGPGSSPIIFENLVIVQSDQQRGSFVAAFDLRDGHEVWRARREELPGWSSPAILPGAHGPELITNSSRFIRGYDPRTGNELWRFDDEETHNKIATPVVAGDVALVTGGGPSGSRPIYAFRAGGRGDITPQPHDSSSPHLAWRTERGSPFTLTPVVYAGRVYVSSDKGVLTAFDLNTGRRLFQQRVAPGDFSASPVVAGGRLYLISETGEAFVLRAGETSELLATNHFEELCLATPAVAGKMLIVRTRSHLYAIAEPAKRGRL